jgi:hypothetical protein
MAFREFFVFNATHMIVIIFCGSILIVVHALKIFLFFSTWIQTFKLGIIIQWPANCATAAGQ